MDISSNEWLDQPLWFSLGWQDMLQQKPSENLKKIIFLWPLLRGFFSSCGKQGLLSGCDARASHYDGFSHCEAWALGTRASVVLAHGLIIVVLGL